MVPDDVLLEIFDFYLVEDPFRERKQYKRSSCWFTFEDGEDEPPCLSSSVWDPTTRRIRHVSRYGHRGVVAFFSSLSSGILSNAIGVMRGTSPRLRLFLARVGSLTML